MRSVRFDSNISDDELREFFGAGVVEEIKRGDWMSDVIVRSEEPVEVLSKRLEDWFMARRAEENARHEQKHVEMYRKRVEEMYKDNPGLPVIMHTQGGKPIKGHIPMDDEGRWLPPVYPETPETPEND